MTELEALEQLEQLGRRHRLEHACDLARAEFMRLSDERYSDPELCADAFRRSNQLHAKLLELEGTCP